MFSIPISQLTTEDLNFLLSENAIENIRIEFKAEIPSKSEFLKKVTSFANTLGGHLIIGAKANSEDGRLKSLPGVDRENGLKQRYVQYCYDSCDPPLAIEVSDPIPSPENSDKYCYVIKIEQSQLAPHFLINRKGVYIRTDEYSQSFEPKFATQHELQELLKNRKIIIKRRNNLIKRAKKRFDSFIDLRFNELSNTQEPIGSRYNISIAPKYPQRPILAISDLNILSQNCRIANWRQVGFPRTSLDTISQHESLISLRPGSKFSILEFNIWGLIFYATDMYDEELNAIHLHQFLGNICVYLKYARSLLAATNFEGEIFLELGLNDIQHINFVNYSNGYPSQNEKMNLDNDIIFTLESNTSNIREDFMGLLRDILRNLFFSMGYAEIALNDNQLNNMIRAGYMYNDWGDPFATQ